MAAHLEKIHQTQMTMLGHLQLMQFEFKHGQDQTTMPWVVFFLSTWEQMNSG